MSKTRAQLFSLAALLISVFSIITLARVTASSQEAANLNNTPNDPLLREIAGYKLWTRATRSPIPVFNAAFAG
jgi:hypothetical protein